MQTKSIVADHREVSAGISTAVFKSGIRRGANSFFFFFLIPHHASAPSPAWKQPVWACLLALCFVGRMVLQAPGKLGSVDQEYNHGSLEEDARWKSENSA